jgi:hypothetical protein
VPGGARRYPVRIELPQASGEIGWAINAAMFNRPPRLVLGLGHDGTGPVTGIVRLDIWRPGDYKFHRSFKRPLVGPPLETNFPIPPLERGLYLYAFSVEGRAVRTGCFRIAPGPLNCRYSIRTEYPGGFPSSTSTEEVTSP